MIKILETHMMRGIVVLVPVLFLTKYTSLTGTYSLFMCQDEDENEDKNQSFGSFWNLCMTNEPILQCIIVLRAWFVRHRLYPERTKTFVFGFVFVFVLAHEQPINPFWCTRRPLDVHFRTSVVFVT